MEKGRPGPPYHMIYTCFADGIPFEKEFLGRLLIFSMFFFTLPYQTKLIFIWSKIRLYCQYFFHPKNVLFYFLFKLSTVCKACIILYGIGRAGSILSSLYFILLEHIPFVDGKIDR